MGGIQDPKKRRCNFWTAPQPFQSTFTGTIFNLLLVLKAQIYLLCTSTTQYLNTNAEAWFPASLYLTQYFYGTKSQFFTSKEGVLQLSLTSEGTLGTYVLINACGVPILGILLQYLPTCLLNMVPVPCLVFILILKTLTWYRYLAFGTGLTHL